MLYWLLFLIVIVSGVIGFRVQLKFARMNYPPGIKWRIALFLPPFVIGATVMYAGSLNAEFGLWETILLMLGVGGFLGMVFAVLFPLNMQHLIPKRKK